VKSLADARQLLINQLRSRYRHTPHQVIIVFDGDGVSEQTIQDRRVRIIYSRAGETADSVIARLAAVAQTAGRKVELYSDDNEVKQSVVQQGGRVGSTNQLTGNGPFIPGLSKPGMNGRSLFGVGWAVVAFQRDPLNARFVAEYIVVSSHC
jgi:YacP-like NYN domain